MLPINLVLGCRESNLGLLVEKRERYLCAMPPMANGVSIYYKKSTKIGWCRSIFHPMMAPSAQSLLDPDFACGAPRQPNFLVKQDEAFF